jgi:hypothetical protein
MLAIHIRESELVRSFCAVPSYARTSRTPDLFPFASSLYDTPQKTAHLCLCGNKEEESAVWIKGTRPRLLKGIQL